MRPHCSQSPGGGFCSILSVTELRPLNRGDLPADVAIGASTSAVGGGEPWDGQRGERFHVRRKRRLTRRLTVGLQQIRQNRRIRRIAQGGRVGALLRRHAAQLEHQRIDCLPAPYAIESLSSQWRRQMQPFELCTMTRRAVLAVRRAAAGGLRLRE